MTFERTQATSTRVVEAPEGSRAVMLWTVVVPVKLLAQAKSRLAHAAGGYRERLALAVATDTVTAALACPRVRGVMVVTDDPVAAPALREIGARGVPDVPDSGLNPALRHGAHVAATTAPGSGVAALSADLPALRPYELTRALDAAAEHEAAFVPDAAGTGTTLYASTSRDGFTPEFGPGSRSRHIAAGTCELDMAGIDSLRHDVDTLADLHAALRLGAGPQTTEIARLLRTLTT